MGRRRWPGGLPAAERSHARIIEALAASALGAFSGATIARLEGRHRALGGNALSFARNWGSIPKNSAARHGPPPAPRSCYSPSARCFPIVPYIALAGMPAAVAGLAASGAALFLIGAGTTLFTGLGVWLSGLRHVLVGFAAAGVTYGVGKLIGVAVTG